MDIFDFMIWKARKTGKYYTLKKNRFLREKLPKNPVHRLSYNKAFYIVPGSHDIRYRAE
jgi:hypothetical protein